MIRGLGLPRLPARNRKTRPKIGLRVAVTLVWSLGPGAPQRVPGEAQELKRERKTRSIAWLFEKRLKTNFLKMCTILECQTHFGQKGPQTERQSRRTAVFFVVALKVARGSPEGRRRALARFLKAL